MTFLRKASLVCLAGFLVACLDKGARAQSTAAPVPPSVPAKAEAAHREVPHIPVPAPAQPSATAYDPREAFAPLTLPGPVNRYRSGNGAPGPDYWQNRADYLIKATLDPVAKVLSGSEVITYTNNSPDWLSSLWLQLDQNIYRRDARAAVSSDFRTGGFTDGFVLDEIAVERQGTPVKAVSLVSDTRLQMRLATPLGPRQQIKLHIRYHYVVPALFGGRTCWVDTRNGPIFDIAQWYPRMAAYDDIRGWDTLPYLAQEFYLEYGDFDYSVTVPADMVIAGSGELVNPAEVLTPLERNRLRRARMSDKTIMIRPASEIPASQAVAGLKTWHFRMKNTRDVAFSASRAFIWDAARLNLPQNHAALAMSVYPVESAGDAAWGRSTEYLKDAVERFSARWGSFPYPVAVNVAGGAGGMEYPALAFDGIKEGGKALFWITAHEIGHSWFPMMVGFDERRDAWMDEGFNTFIDTFESDEFEGGVYGPKRDSEYAWGGGNPADEIIPILADPQAPPILSRADTIIEKYRHPVTYFKSAFGLVLLRDEILGPQRFDPAFRKFIAEWSYKHPKPSDFFRAMESEGGEDLSWWWRGWYLNNWQLDLAVTGAAYVDRDPGKGISVTIENRDRLVMPAVMEIRFQDGHATRVSLPAETWIQRAKAILTLPGGGTVKEIVIDPDHRLPDRDRQNNTYVMTVPSATPKP